VLNPITARGVSHQIAIQTQGRINFILSAANGMLFSFLRRFSSSPSTALMFQAQ